MYPKILLLFEMLLQLEWAIAKSIKSFIPKNITDRRYISIKYDSVTMKKRYVCKFRQCYNEEEISL